MDKNEYVDWMVERYEGSDRQVIQFITDFTFRNDKNGDPTDVINDVFSNGYCYYFANMLKTAFGRGEVCWSEGRSHIVWVDTNNIAYDIYGVYEDYTRLRPVSYLGNTVVSFMHTGAEYHLGPVDFADWCKHYKTTEIFAITYIWLHIPKKELAEYDSQPYFDNVEKVACDYWIKHQSELGELFAEMRHRRNQEG